MFKLIPFIALSSVLSVNAFAQTSDPKNDNEGLLETGKKLIVEKVEDTLTVTEDESYFTIRASYSPWFVTWEQNSTAASRFGSDAINVNYQIDSTLAHMGRVEIDILDTFTFDFNLVELPEDSSTESNALSALSFGINYTDFIGETSLQYRYTQASFEGQIRGDLNKDKVSTGSFETDALSHDIVLMTKWHIGLGYRSFSYELPQDVYLVKKDSPNTALLSGFVDMDYDADFYQVVYQHDDLFGGSNLPITVGVSFRYGIGTMTPSSNIITQVEQSLGQKVINDADASLFEFNLYADYVIYKKDSLEGNIRFGYRSESMEAEFDAGSEYSLVTDFETNFSGPYATFNLSW